MLRTHGSLALVLGLAAFTGGCARPAPVSAKSDTKPSTVAAVPHSRELDDTARFVAGLPGTSGSPFAELENTEVWKRYRLSVDAAWSKVDSQLLAGLRSFQKDELDRSQLRAAPVFYPFGGPDALTPVLYFPYSPSYVMVALEPAGTLPTFDRIRKKPLGPYLAAMRTTMASELGRSFFVTREMDRQFRGQVTDGLLLPISQLLVRTGNSILGFRYVRLDDEGRLIDRAADYHAPGNIGNKGVELEFQAADGSVHRLLYLSVNLSDQRLKPNRAFQQFAATLKGSTTMLKATSYMTHHADFSVVRDLVLANSSAVLQDDSGMPFHCFTSGRWQVQLYGDYQRPYGSFRWLEQIDLRKAYATSQVKPLPMHVGYGYRKITSNLLLAVKK